MVETDGGVFRPLGFGFSGNDAARATVKAVASLLAGIGATRIGPAGGGADIGPSVQAGKVPSMSLDVDGALYFTIHHTAADTVDKIEPTDIARCVAALAVMGYVVADLPTRLGLVRGRIHDPRSGGADPAPSRPDTETTCHDPATEEVPAPRHQRPSAAARRP